MTGKFYSNQEFWNIFSKQLFEVGSFTVFEIRIEYISLEDILLRDKILAFMIWFWYKSFSLMSLWSKISFFPSCKNCMFQLSPLKKHAIYQSYLSLRLAHDMTLPFSNNCNKKLKSLLENFGKFIAVPLISWYLLNHKN